jgi:hypothetical protein
LLFAAGYICSSRKNGLADHVTMAIREKPCEFFRAFFSIENSKNFYENWNLMPSYKTTNQHRLRYNLQKNSSVVGLTEKKNIKNKRKMTNCD